ncbi:MAG: L,D-transpeptidase [Candidatus Omnitrophica bacterium]|nr:L,D-transpeptidase [Candidatus Omnitrophota bacterium]
MDKKQHPKRFIKVSIRKQRLCLREGGRIIKEYPISTSKYGIGNKSGSNKTPLGSHRIISKIGRNADSGCR